ncbi:terminase small subunit-like protein [Legionella drancourtii]|uniref:Terminase small subunit protein n=1 Tax=Legionella drancourtii LLAP12 TaxID=658187 RepID=G9EL83_9GAMM|nr:hypothetical protein [Legionella drancourtii]EHL31972.1 hypothetical protein LDG_6142 [Legionella drancourtii LLAP12]
MHVLHSIGKIDADDSIQARGSEMKALKSKNGRPTTYTLALAKEICDAIASSSKGIKALCQGHPHWPNKDTIFTWLKENQDFSDQYARAKQAQIECVVDELLEIADDSSQDQVFDSEGQIHFNGQAIQRAKLRIDTRKWLACKLVPKVYGSIKPDNVRELSVVEKLINKLEL